MSEIGAEWDPAFRDSPGLGSAARGSSAFSLQVTDQDKECSDKCEDESRGPESSARQTQASTESASLGPAVSYPVVQEVPVQQGVRTESKQDKAARYAQAEPRQATLPFYQTTDRSDQMQIMEPDFERHEPTSEYERIAMQAAAAPSSTLPPEMLGPGSDEGAGQRKKVPAAEMTPEALNYAARREAEPEATRNVAHVVALADLTPGGENVLAATVVPEKVMLPLREEQDERFEIREPKENDRVRMLLDQARELNEEIARLKAEVGSRPDEAEVGQLRDKVVELTEILERRAEGERQEMFDREDKVRELELLAQQVGWLFEGRGPNKRSLTCRRLQKAQQTSRQALRNLTDIQRENGQLRVLLRELDIVKEQLALAKSENESMHDDLNKSRELNEMMRDELQDREKAIMEVSLIERSRLLIWLSHGELTNLHSKLQA